MTAACSAGLTRKKKSVRVKTFVERMHAEVGTIAHSCGVPHPRALQRYHCRIVQPNGRSVPMNELYPDVTKLAYRSLRRNDLSEERHRRVADSSANGSCVTSIARPHGDAQLYERGRRALRVLQSGADLKPPQAAVVKSRGGERCGNARTRFWQVWLRGASASEPLQKCRKWIRGCQNRG